MGLETNHASRLGDNDLARVLRDNQDESGATIKMREPVPVLSRRKGVARP